MSNAIAATDLHNESVQNRRIFMQLGLFGILLIALIVMADVAPAHGSCTGIAALSGRLLPVIA